MRLSEEINAYPTPTETKELPLLRKTSPLLNNKTSVVPIFMDHQATCTNNHSSINNLLSTNNLSCTAHPLTCTDLPDSSKVHPDLCICKDHPLDSSMDLPFNITATTNLLVEFTVVKPLLPQPPLPLTVINNYTDSNTYTESNSSTKMSFADNNTTLERLSLKELLKLPLL